MYKQEIIIYSIDFFIIFELYFIISLEYYSFHFNNNGSSRKAQEYSRAKKEITGEISID